MDLEWLGGEELADQQKLYDTLDIFVFIHKMYGIKFW